MFNEICNKKLKIDYNNVDGFSSYPSDLKKEYVQCLEEGLDVEKYKKLFDAAYELENGEYKNRISDILYEMAVNSPIRCDYKYNEPSEYNEIQKLRIPFDLQGEMPDEETLRKKLLGAWTGRACGCLLGKPVECIRSDEFIPFLKETGNYPMHRYILSTDITDEVCSHYKFGLKNKPYADTVNGMPVDDDTNYVVLAQKIIEDYGRNFSSENVASAWMKYQSIYSYFTAERTAYINFTKCIVPPSSAIYKNVAREWIGAQIRGDYFGYINPGNPESAAKMAYNDARISHVKNGIYGEMFASAMVACAAVTDDIEQIILGGLSQIPSTSRLYEAVTKIMDCRKNGASVDDCFNIIHADYDEHTDHGWCHTISNAMIVTAALLYGEGDFGKSICCAVGMAFDTDCNGATVGSILGMRNGINGIDDYWKKPVNGIIHTSVFGCETVDIEQAVEKTLSHTDY